MKKKREEEEEAEWDDQVRGRGNSLNAHMALAVNSKQQQIQEDLKVVTKDFVAIKCGYVWRWISTKYNAAFMLKYHPFVWPLPIAYSK